MIQAESNSLIIGLDLSATMTDHGPIKKGEEEPLERFLQVWMETSEGIEPPTLLNQSIVEEKIENLNAEVALTQTALPEESGLPLQDEGEKKGIEAEPSVIVAPPAVNVREQINHSFIGTGLMPYIDSGESGEKGSVTVPAMEASALLGRPGPETVSNHAVTLGTEQPGPGQTVLFDLDGKGRVTVPAMEASALLGRPGPETVSNHAVTQGTEQPVELNPARRWRPGPEQTVLFDLDGKGDGVIRSLSSSGSGVADFGGENNAPFQGKEGDEIASALPGHPLSEEFPAMIQLDSDTTFDRSVQAQDPVAENRLPDSLSVEKLLLRQVAEKIHHWRPHEGDVIRFRLKPETLGMLQVDISIHENGIVADIIAEHHFVKTLLEQNQALLHKTLSAQGLSVDRFSVNVGTPDHHNADRQDYRQDSESPRSFSEEDERVSPLEANKISEPGNHAINLYV